MSMNFWRTFGIIMAVMVMVCNLLIGPTWLGLISMWFMGATITMVVMSIMVERMRDAFHEMHVAYTMMKKCNDDIIKLYTEKNPIAPTISPDRGIDKRLH